MIKLSRQWEVQEAERRRQAERAQGKDPYFFNTSANLWGHTLDNDDMSLVFYDVEDIRTLGGIFRDLSDPVLEKAFKTYSDAHVTNCMKLYNLGPICRNYRDSGSVLKSIADKWEHALEYFEKTDSADYVDFVDYCTSFLRHDLHTFLFFLPNYLMSQFSANKDVELHYHWRLAINK